MRRRHWLRGALGGGLTALALAQGAAAQGVLVAPHAVYLDHRTRSGSVFLYNPGSQPVEVTVSASFGYPVTDSAGTFTIRTPDSVEAGMPSAAGWIAAFPRRLALPPLSRQTVRLLARPPQGLPDGEYWARLIVRASGGAVPVTGADTGGIQIGLALEVQTTLPLSYRKGTLRTGLSVARMAAAKERDSLAVRVKLERQGTAAYIGTARGELVSDAGALVSSFSEPVAVYYGVEPVFRLPLRGVKTGRYRLRLSFTTERNDVAPDFLIQAPPVRDSLEVVLP